jgi:hypothetical protein
MPNPTVTDSKIKQWVGATYAQRGKSYFNSGQVLSMRWRGQVLTGEVQGSEYEPYSVHIQFVRDGVEGECSCPMDYNCKHVAALLYAYAAEPPRAPKTGPALTKALAKLEQPALVELVKAMLEEAPELEEVVEARLLTARVVTTSAAPDDMTLRQEVQKVLKRLRDFSQHRKIERDLQAWRKQATTLMIAKHWEQAQMILSVLVSELIVVDESIGTDAVDDVLDQMVGDLQTCWQALPANSAARRDSLRGLFDFLAWQIHLGWGNVGTGHQLAREMAKHARPTERDQIQEWIALAMRQAPMADGRGYTGYADDDYGYDPDDYDDSFLQPHWAKLQKQFTLKAPKPKAKPKKTATASPRKKSKS